MGVNAGVRAAGAMLLLVAGLAVSLAVAGPSERAWMYCVVPVVLLGVAWGMGFLPAGWRRGNETGLAVGFGLADVALTVGPALAAGFVETPEILLLSAFRGVATGLWAGGAGRGATLSATIAVFVMVFGAALAAGWSRTWLLTAGTAAATLFLLAKQSAGASGGVATVPAAAVLVCVTVVAGVVGWRIPSDHASSRGWWAVMPSSGGVVEGSDRARSGVGDGPDEVRGGRDARTSGFDRGEVFVNSDHPGLYDAFIESFGEPVRKLEQLKLIGLKRQQILTSEAHTAQDLRSGRSLQLRRSAPKPAGEAAERAAGALLLVGGPTPLRMKLAVYDVYDPEAGEWIETPPPKQNAALYPNSGGPGWMKPVDAPSSPMLGGEVAHEIRLGDIETDVLPLPEFVTAFKLGRVDRADWFAGGPGHVTRLFHRRLPAGSVLDVRSRPADLALRHDDVPARLETTEPLPLDPRIAALAKEWTAGIAAGWDQVGAVVSAAGHHAVVGDSAGRGDEVSRFLFESRVGRSPQFASATAVLLRSLGYRVRLAAGFYADPAKVDRASGLVRVGGADAHVWPEVLTMSGAWVAVEPTPGFALSAPRGTWGSMLRAGRDVAVATARVWVPVLCVAGLALLFRARLTDLVATVVWRLRLPRDARRAVVTTTRLLELRARLAGRPRRGGETVRRFLAVTPAAAAFASLAEWAAYAPADYRTPTDDARRACLAVVRGVGISVWKKPVTGDSDSPLTPEVRFA